MNSIMNNDCDEKMGEKTETISISVGELDTFFINEHPEDSSIKIFKNDIDMEQREYYCLRYRRNLNLKYFKLETFEREFII